MPTFTQIGSAVTVGSGGASDITFSSIPSTFTDLVLKVSVRSSRSGSVTDGIELTFNGVGGTSYASRRIYAYSTSPASDSLPSSAFIYADPATAGSATASTFNNSEFYIPNYTSTTNKSISLDNTAENNASNPALILVAGLFTTSSAISSIKVKPSSGNWVEFSTAYLYGVSNA